MVSYNAWCDFESSTGRLSIDFGHKKFGFLSDTLFFPRKIENLRVLILWSLHCLWSAKLKHANYLLFWVTVDPCVLFCTVAFVLDINVDEISRLLQQLTENNPEQRNEASIIKDMATLTTKVRKLVKKSCQRNCL
jgi:hypothetical protein